MADLLSPPKAPAATSKAAATHQQTDRFWGCPGCPFDLFYSPEHSLSTRLLSAPCSISQHKKIPLVSGVTSQSKFKLFCPVPLASHYDQCLGTAFPQLFGFFGQTHSFLQNWPALCRGFSPGREFAICLCWTNGAANTHLISSTELRLLCLHYSLCPEETFAPLCAKSSDNNSTSRKLRSANRT